MILTNGRLVLGGEDVSDTCTAINVRQGRKQEPNSAMGDDTEVFENGVRTITFTSTHKATPELLTILRAIDEAGEPVECVLRRDKDEAVSESNPQATGDFNMADFNPLDAAWGAKQMVNITWSPASSLAWATS